MNYETLQPISHFQRNGVSLYCGNSLDFYKQWDAPTVIISDGAYGIDGFEGDVNSHDLLSEWYEPHIKQWSKLSNTYTTLWVFNTEIGWANIHPVLKRNGWKYVRCCIWDKGISHVAGRVNTFSIKQFPCCSEVVVQYVRKISGNIAIENPLRKEWERSDLPLYLSNVACGVKSAASRKYLSSDSQFYLPGHETFEKMKQYANSFGVPDGKPYFENDILEKAGNIINVTKQKVKEQFPKFHCPPGVTNVFHFPHLGGDERIHLNNGKNAHPNQKPLQLMELLVNSSSDEGDVVWEPFGGLFTASLAAVRNGRIAFGGEINPDYYEIGIKRFETNAHFQQELPFPG